MAFVSPRDNSMTTNKQTALLSSVSSLDPAATISSKSLIWSADMPFLAWMESPLAMQKLMLSLQLLLTSAGKLVRHPAVRNGRGMAQADPAQFTVMAEVMPQIKYAQQQHHALCLGQSGHGVTLLRSALLLLKLIDLTSAVNDKTHSQKPLDVLWKALHFVTCNLNVHNNHRCPNPRDCQPTAPGPMEEFAEEKHLSHVIVPVLLSSMRKDIKQDGKHIRKAWLLLLAMMMPKRPLSESIVSAFIDSGQLYICILSHTHNQKHECAMFVDPSLVA